VATTPGDLFVILTDGLTEVFSVEDEDEEFGEERIVQIVASRLDRPLVEIHGEILRAARAFGPQVDDQTLLLARVKGDVYEIAVSGTASAKTLTSPTG
jgi:serine phosphatase RsbU (regulator of sigma subunit)